MTAREVPAALDLGEARLHRFQVVREHRDDGGHEDWVVVGWSAAGVELASVGFDWTRTASRDDLRDGTLEPLSAGGVPVWGY